MTFSLYRGPLLNGDYPMWFASFASKRKVRRKSLVRQVRAAFRPHLEVLEDRSLPSAGALDPTFGTGGLISGTNVPGATQAYANAVVVQADGKIVSGGLITVNGLYSVTGTTTRFALERYNPDGTPDAGFGTNGVVQTVVGVGQSYITGLALQSDGRIVAVGYAQCSLQPVVDTAFAVTRYNVNGSLDTTFGNHGIVLTNVVPVTRNSNSLGYPGVERAITVAIQGDGKIDVGGFSCPGDHADSSEFTIVRYNANGTLDKTFGSGKTVGIVVTPTFGISGDMPTALAIKPDGQILLAGYVDVYSPSMAVVRYTSVGKLDSTFGNNGIVSGLAPSGSTASAAGIIVQNGDPVLVGTSKTGSTSNLVLARLTSTGRLDTTFGGSNTGFATDNMAGGSGIVQAPNGDLLVSSASRATSYDVAVAAFLPNGTLDQSFGTNGVGTADFAGGADAANSVAVQGDGKIVAAGSTLPVGGDGYDDLALARFLPPNTKICSATANPNPVPGGTTVILSASNILNSNPTSTITQVTFYLDSNDDGMLDSGDSCLGSGTQTSPGAWTFNYDTTLLTPGSYTLFVQATDSYGILSDPLVISLTVL
jgi:uncharacterized delta-60 repeat protein